MSSSSLQIVSIIRWVLVGAVVLVFLLNIRKIYTHIPRCTTRSWKTALGISYVVITILALIPYSGSMSDYQNSFWIRVILWAIGIVISSLGMWTDNYFYKKFNS